MITHQPFGADLLRVATEILGGLPQGVEAMEVVGSFRSPVPLTTGILWDGSAMWITGVSPRYSQYPGKPRSGRGPSWNPSTSR